MCGICGVRRFGDEPIREEQIRLLLLANMRRGNHATGLAIQNPDEEIQVLKNDEPAWNFTRGEAYLAFIKKHLREDTLIVIGHTRQATQGNPRDLTNDHPLYAGTTAVIHNGHISNDDSLFKAMNIKREGEVDSDIIRGILDSEGITKKGIKELSRMSGSAAIAAMSNDFPGKLLLARSGNPIVLAATPGQMVFSSEKAAIHVALRPFVERYGLWMQANRVDVMWQTMNNDSAYVFNDQTLEWHQEFRVASYYNEINYRVNDNYRVARGKWYKDDKADLVWCKECKVFLPLSKSQMKEALWNLICQKCKNPLAEKETAS